MIVTSPRCVNTSHTEGNNSCVRELPDYHNGPCQEEIYSTTGCWGNQLPQGAIDRKKLFSRKYIHCTPTCSFQDPTKSTRRHKRELKSDNAWLPFKSTAA